MDEWFDGWMNGWTNGWMDGWLVGWMDGWTAVTSISKNTVKLTSSSGWMDWILS